MLNFPLIYKAVGTLLYLEALLLALCLGMGVWAGENNPATFGIPVAVAALTGFALPQFRT